MDLRNSLVKIAYCSQDSFDKEAVPFLTNLLESHRSPLVKLNLWLESKGTSFLLSNTSPTAADFHLFEMLDQISLLHTYLSNHQPTSSQMSGVTPILTKFKSLDKFYNSFKSLDAITQYLNTDAAKLPINNPVYARFV
eukprot:GHVN01060881.1.p1 GENE.GHVN01060881.1~~GHVN01060881.1.p1  ORF type:complete len:138 (-),score=15.11 GHVN01060881.1:101-514(-)